MPGRAIRTTARIAFLLCGLISLFTGVPYVMLRGVGLPVQSEWVIFVVALALVAFFSATLCGAAPLLHRKKHARKIGTMNSCFQRPSNCSVAFAAISYVLALVAYLAPHRWNLDPQLMLSLCPMYFVKMTFDPRSWPSFSCLLP